MIDHLIRLGNAAAFDPTDYGLEEGTTGPAFGQILQGTLNGNRVDLVGIEIIRVVGNEETPKEVSPGYWFALRANEYIPDLPSLMVALDEDLAKQELPYIYFKHQSFTWGTVKAVQAIFPLWCGDGYRFGEVLDPTNLIQE